MNTTAGPRHTGALKDRQESLRKDLKTTDPGKAAGRLFAFTIDASTAQVVKFETLDASGVRCELTDDEKTLLGAAESGGLEQALEQAFEAGIDCVLGSEEDKDETEEGEQERDRELRHLLLAPLLEHSLARHLLKREVLNRAILGTLIHHSMKPQSAAAANAPATTEAERAAANRTN